MKVHILLVQAYDFDVASTFSLVRATVKKQAYWYQIDFKYFKYTKNSVGFTRFASKQLLVTV